MDGDDRWQSELLKLDASEVRMIADSRVPANRKPRISPLLPRASTMGDAVLLEFDQCSDVRSAALVAAAPFSGRERRLILRLR